MLKVLIPAVGLLGLVAVAAQTYPSLAMASEGADDAHAGMAWRVAYEGPVAKLTYGVADSDHLAVMMTCAPGDGYAEVHGAVKPDAATLTLASSGPAEIDPMTGEIAMRVSVTDPALTGLARRGAMKAVSGEAETTLRADAGERRVVDDFLSYCQKMRA